MAFIQSNSLAQTVDAVNEAFFFSRPIPRAERTRIARWIAGRQGRPRAYANTFALFEDERRAGIRLFTGERAACAAARHIAGEEACRALRLLKVRDKAVRGALDAAGDALALRVGPVGPRKPISGLVHWLAPYGGGTYCCGRCSVSFWRHLTAGGFDNADDRLALGLKCLKACRQADGQWRVFPFWYTLSALIEMPADLARAEIQHAAPRLERAQVRLPHHSQR